MAATAAAVTVASAAFTVGAATASSQHALAPLMATQALVVLLGPHTVMSAPSQHSRVLERVSARRPITGTETVLPVLAHRSTQGEDWLNVRLPGRPNGHTG